jgi:hypothetical protein
MVAKSKVAKLVELLRSKPTELDAYLVGVIGDELLDGTKATLRCYALCLDGSLLPRQDDLARYLVERLIDYAIPRSEIQAAIEASEQPGNSTAPMFRLVRKAASLFTSQATTGEPGELLLYHLAETVLRATQVLCKLPHKTNSAMHVHGIDGMHVRYDAHSKSLHLYWGESKLKTSFSSALEDGLEDLKPYLCGDTHATRERDLELVRDHVDFADDAIEDAFLEYLDPNSTKHNATVHRGLSLIGFDYEHYPSAPNALDREKLFALLRDSYKRWKPAVQKRVTDAKPLDSIELDVFLVPMPSTEEFRAAFLRELSHVSS